MFQKKKIIILCLGIIIIVSLIYIFFQISKSRTWQFFGGLTNRVATREKVVALTFDDAPSPYTKDVLKILADENIKATFYIIGENAEKFPEETKAIIEQGNELGNHSYSHKRLVFKTLSFIKNEMERTNELIRAVGYVGEITFRPPNGKKLFLLPWYLRQHNIKTIMWDVEPDTYVSGNAQAISEHVLKNTKPGSIILLHPFCDAVCVADREALPSIIDSLKARGYEFKTASELLDYKNK